jgi:hypothetical protein
VIIINDAVLALFRVPGYCDGCNRWCRERECHHVQAKGMGGGKTLDVAINILAVGRSG